MVAEVIEVENDQTNQDAKFILVDESYTENYTDQTCGEWVEDEELHPTPSSNQGLPASKASFWDRFISFMPSPIKAYGIFLLVASFVMMSLPLFLGHDTLVIAFVGLPLFAVGYFLLDYDSAL